MLLGKGSGKDAMSRIACAYVVHKLLCLKDPQGYYGKSKDTTIDIVNMALNSDQAYRVFFNPLKKMLLRSPWFNARKVNDHVKSIEFENDIYIYSLHSDPEGAEGLNIIVAVLDEIDGFTVEGASASMYNYLHMTVTTRFSESGKVICLSFPRSKSGWMMTKYNQIVQEKETTTFSHVFKLNESLPDGSEGNEFTVTWDEDEIISYKEDNWFAIKAPTFRVNPIVKIEHFKDSFYSDLLSHEAETLLRVCANPPDHVDSIFFKNQELLKDAFDQPNGWNENTETLECRPDPSKEYYVHVDLSKVSDRTVVAMGHVPSWQQVQIGGELVSDVKPRIYIDLFRVWEPTHNRPVNNGEVVNFIMDLCKKFNVRKVTFDRWGSVDMIKYLVDRDIKSERRSLNRQDYEDWKHAVQDGRIKGPQDARFFKELENLIINKNGKIDHPNTKGHHNDISEAVCGVVANCIEENNGTVEIEIVTPRSLQEQMLQESVARDKLERPKETPPPELRDFLTRIEFL